MSKPTVHHPRCPFCHEEVLPADAKEACHKCMSWQHTGCWDEQGSCASCGTARRVEPAAEGGAVAAAATHLNELRFYTFRSGWSSWSTLFEEAAEFATTLGPARLAEISHSADQSDGVVTVWYWVQRRPGDFPSRDALAFKVFSGTLISWDGLHRKAAELATQLGPGRVAAISHSADKSNGVVTVWYWT